MKTKLRDIAEVKAGFTVRAPSAGVKTKSYPVIQIKNVRGDARLDLNDLTYAELTEVKGVHFLKQGDVLFCARGTRNAAAAFDGQIDDVVAGSQLFVIRIRDQDVLPSYLAWYMNQAAAQAYLSQYRSGSYIRMVRRAALLSMPIVLPSADTQQRILDLWSLGIKEQGLLDELKERRRDLVTAQCDELLGSGR